MTGNLLISAAQYLRMSTEHQQYSTANQECRIQEYAESHGFTVTRTYADSAKSGLWLKGRPGLRDLLRDVTQGGMEYKAILVYDVSRWGRFQDTYEPADYEFLCKSAGIPVHYCAETFVNDGSLPSSIMKALKRAMAGHSRELGVKVSAGQTRLAGLGFWQGGPPGIGYRRMPVSPDRTPKQMLATGERKSISTDRVVLGAWACRRNRRSARNLPHVYGEENEPEGYFHRTQQPQSPQPHEREMDTLVENAGVYPEIRWVQCVQPNHISPWKCRDSPTQKRVGHFGWRSPRHS